MAALEIRGTQYPVLLPKLRDPRLHLAATITSLQVIGQVGFHFELSIAQILLAVGTSALLEVAIALRTRRVILWPASAMLTGNGVAFVLRVPGTAHGDWWSLRGWWIFVGTAAISLLSKYVIRRHGEHVFNPSNIGLVVCFLALGRNRAAPLDFWWGPTSVWLGLALAVIVTGGFAILLRLQLLRVALGFWISFAGAVGVLALAGHTMTARWHLGPISGFHLWWVLVTSPEVLVFLFFMITDPKTAPRSPTGRLAYPISLGLLAGVLIAPTTSEFAAKVALLGALTLVCLALPLLRLVPKPTPRDRRLVAGLAAAAVAFSAAAIVIGNAPAVANASRALPAGTLPPIAILPGRGVQTKLDLHTAQLIAHDLLAAKPSAGTGLLKVWLVQGVEQGPPTATVQLAGLTYHLHQTADLHWALPSTTPTAEVVPPPVSTVLRGLRLTNVAPAVGLDFRQDSFRNGVSNEYTAMMGGGVCWLDYNGDGWQDLFAVNSYASADTSQWQAHGGLPRTQLFENEHGHFRNVTAKAHAGLQVQGDGCVAADLNGDGRPDLVVTTANGIKLLWNNGNGTFTEGARAAGLNAAGWYTGVAVADVNGDGRPDIFVAGYARQYDSVPNSFAGFPTNLVGVRDLLYLNEGNSPTGRAHFREVGVQAGLEASDFSHGLGATFLDANGDGRPDLYVANDEDPNQLYVNVPWPGGAKADPLGLGFRFENRAAVSGVADPYAGMGVAVDGAGGGGPLDLFVTNSRHEPSAAFAGTMGSSFSNARSDFDPALGVDFAGWGDSFVDLANSGRPDLVLATGGIPVTNLQKDAGDVKVIAPLAGEQVTRYGVASGVAPDGLRVNGRGLAAADVDNNGRMAMAINSIGGKLLLLEPTGPVGHWLDVKLSRFVPGAVVTADLGKTAPSQEVRAGSSYLSSEDQRVHFGLGSRTRVQRLTVRYPWGATSVLHDVPADRIVGVRVPPRQRPRVSRSSASARIAACAPASASRSIATVWNRTAVAALRSGAASEPVQARDLFDLSNAMWNTWKATSRNAASAQSEAVSYAAFRVLVWQASFNSNLGRTFALLTRKLRSLCLSPDFSSTSGRSPAALGNRIGAAAIAAARHDGSNEALHYADPTFTSPNHPLIVHATGSTVENASFWQPLALGTIQPHSLTAIPADVQSFVGAEWGHVSTFALSRSRRKLVLGVPDPSGSAYKRGAVAVLRATSTSATAPRVWTPLSWNTLAEKEAPGKLAADVRLYLGLDGALNDAAVATWGAKRTYRLPRPVSMIRYLAFQGQSSDQKSADYSADGLPLVPGLIELRDGKLEVLSHGRWIDGGIWTPPTATPPSPGGVAEASAFAYAAGSVLSALTGHSYAEQIRAASMAPIADGIDVPSDVTAGRALGERVAADVLRKLRRY